MTRLSSIIIAGLITCSLAGIADAQIIEWTRQMGSPFAESNNSVSADGQGNVYLSGHTGGSLGGPNSGGNDAFVSKYDQAGVFKWVRQLGTSAEDFSSAVSADGLGNVYLTGHTAGSLGGPNSGGWDAFISKYDEAGNFQWVRQLGTSVDDRGYGVAADPLGNVFLAGATNGSLGNPSAGAYDAYLRKYDSTGSLQWTRQFGTSSDDIGFRVSVDGLGNAYVSGNTAGSLGGPSAGRWDAFVRKYDSAGNVKWTRQLGTTVDELGVDVSADSIGNVYLSGRTQGSLGGPNAGFGFDAFVSKFDAVGNFQWVRQLGTSGDETGSEVSADGLGSVYITGRTNGSLGGVSAGAYDAFVSKYDSAGVFHWTHQFGTSTNDFGLDISADGRGLVFMSGSTEGSVGEANAGSNDAFVTKFGDPFATNGDFDTDSVVDGADFLIWQRGVAPGGLAEDGLVIWRVNFGAASTTDAVPEPRAAIIAFTAGICCLAGRSRKTVLFPGSILPAFGS